VDTLTFGSLELIGRIELQLLLLALRLELLLTGLKSDALAVGISGQQKALLPVAGYCRLMHT